MMPEVTPQKGIQILAQQWSKPVNRKSNINISSDVTVHVNCIFCNKLVNYENLEVVA